MSSIVSEILASAKRGSVCQQKDLNDCIEKLASNSHSLKQALLWDLKKDHCELEILHEPSLDLVVKVEERMTEMNELKEKVENAKTQLHLSTQEYSTLKTQLDVSKEIIDILDTLAKLNADKQLAKTHLKSGHFLKAAKALNQAEKLLNIFLKDDEEIKVIGSLKTDLTVLREEIVFESRKAFKMHFCFTQTKEFSKFQINGGGQPIADKLVDILDTLYCYGQLDNHLRQFSIDLINILVKPALTKTKGGTFCSNLELVHQDSTATIITLIKDDTASHTVFEQLDKILEMLKVLNSTLFSLTPDNIPEGITTLLRPHLTPKLLDELLGALDTVLPQANGESSVITPESYSTQVSALAASLREMALLNEDDDKRFGLYVSNLPKLCATKQCQDALVTARTLMTSNMLDSVEVGSKDGDQDFLSVADANMDVTGHVPCELEPLLDALDDTKLKGILSSPFRFPKCNVSRSIFDLVQLALKTFQAACADSTAGVQLIFTVRKMFELFLDIIPVFHGKLITELPLASALHHNNAMFIAHHITTFGILFKTRLPEELKGGSAVALLVDLIHPLKKVAAKHFLATMNSLRQQLLETLKGAKGFLYDPENSTIKYVDKTLKQVCHQLNQLARTWQGVLPDSLLTRSLALLINFVVGDIVSSLLCLEDIGADFAFQLHQLLKNMEISLPKLLVRKDDQNETVVNASKLVPKWQRFTEIIIILNANLSEISERWAEGKGQLASTYSAFEVKNLIRALFENNEKRARVLKIIDRS